VLFRSADDFGGFEEAIVAAPVVSDDDDVGDFNETDQEEAKIDIGGMLADRPSLLIDRDAYAFEMFGSSHRQPIASLEHVGNEDFGDFEEVKESKEGIPADDQPFSSEFDSLEPLDSHPIPSMLEHAEHNRLGEFEQIEKRDIQSNPVSNGNISLANNSLILALDFTTNQFDHTDVYQDNEVGPLPTDTAMSRQAATASVYADPFCALESVAEVANCELPPLSSFSFGSGPLADTEAANDDFGDFETPISGTTPANDINLLNPPIIGDKVSGDDDFSFGDFKTPAGSASPVEFQGSSDFAGFEAAFTDQVMLVDEGDFLGTALPQQTVVAAPSVDTDVFFEWIAPPLEAADNVQVPPTDHSSDMDDDFGDLRNYTSPGPSYSKPDANDFFATFDKEVPSQGQTQPDGSGTLTPFDVDIVPERPTLKDNFASFMTAFESEEMTNNHFADFERAEPTEVLPSGNLAPATGGAKSSDRDISQTSNQSASLKELREKVRSLSRNLPKALGQRLDGSGKTVDFFKAFETGIKGQTRNFSWAKSNDTSKLVMANRCVEVMARASEANIYIYWFQAMVIIRDELVMGLFLFEEAKGLPIACDREKVCPSLGIFLRGLGEYVRIVRSIIATIGDLMCLDPLVEFSPTPVATIWADLAILNQAVEVETLWAKILKVTCDLGLIPAPAIETVTEMRLTNSPVEGGPLCRLTLQRLSSRNSGTTKAQVYWEGKDYMACSANFWFNVVSPALP